MSEELFNEWADLAALDEQKKYILSIFQQIKDGLSSFKDVGIQIEGSKSIKEFASAQDQYNAYIKDTDRLKKNLLDSEKKLYEAERKYAEIIASNRVELGKKNAELKAQAQYEQANTGSIEKARAAIKQLTQERDKLNLFTEEGRKKQDKLNESINKYNEFLKKSVSALEAQKMNVGNYAGSLAKPFELLQLKLNEIKKNLEKGIGIGGGTSAADLQKANTVINTIETALTKSAKAGANSTNQVKNLTNAFADLSITYKSIGGSSETSFLGNLEKSIGVAKDEVQDLKDRIKLQASDTKGIENITGSLNALAGVAQGAAGAYALFGASEEDAAKVTAKLIAVQGIANSIQQVGNEVAKEGTIVNKGYVFVQGLVATATDRTAAATTRLAAASKLLSIGLIVAAVTALVYVMVKAADATALFTKEQLALSDINKRATETYAEQVVKLKLLVNEYQNVNTSSTRRKEIQEELNKLAPAYFDNLKSEAEFQKDIAEQANKATQALILQAKVQAAQGLLTEKFKEVLEKQFDPGKAVSFFDIVAGKFRNLGSLLRPNLAVSDVVDMGERAEKNVAKAKEEYSDFEKFIQQFINDTNKELDALGGNTAGTKKEKDAKAKKITDNTAQDILKSNYELNKIILERQAKAAKEILDNETKTYEERTAALRAFTEKQVLLVELEKQFEIDSEKLKLAGILQALEEQKKEKGANIQAINEQERKEKQASDLRMKIIYEKGADNLVKVGEDFNKSLKALKQQRDDLRKEEEKDLKDYEEFTMGWLKAFRKKQQDENDKWDKADADALKKNGDARKDAMKRLYQELFTTITFFLTASIDREVASLDTKKRLLDEDTQRRINQINQLGMAEQDRVKETAKVEKQAFFETQQIEAKKRRLAVERARFEKLANIASIISSTAQAVVGALKPDGSTPLPLRVALAGIIGGIGALQLARAIAAPLPQYRTGTSNAKKGTAIVGEEGEELMERNGQYFLTPGKPTLMEMAGGEKITPAHLTRDIMASVNFSRMAAAGGLVALKHNGMSDKQADRMISEIKDLKGITAKSRIMIHNEAGIESSAYYLNNIKN